MHKNTLIDILFETTQNSSPVKRMPFEENYDQQIIRKQYQNVFRKAQRSQRNSKIIKITQFNSSLVISDQKVHQNQFKQQFCTFQQRNFNIKKIGDLKAKITLSAQKILQTQLKKSQKKTQIHLHKSCIQSNPKTPIEKILVTTKCNIKNQRLNIHDLTASINLEECDNTTERNNDDPFSHLYNGKNKSDKRPKEILNPTNKSTKSYKNQGSGKIQCIEFPTKSDELLVVQKKNSSPPRRHYSKHIQEQKKYQQMIEQQKKDMLQIKKQLNKNYAKPFNPPQNITSFAYILYEADAKKSKFLRKLSLRRQDNPQSTESRKVLLNSYKVVVSLNSRSPVEIASLTKIMTCILTLDLAKKYCLKLNEEMVTIGIFEQNIGGTSANIKRGQIYSIEQLLYGLMLPSGNDASLAISVWGGRLLLRKQGEKKDLLGSTACSNSQMINFRKKDCYQRFICEMNAKANELNMQKTRYANSHGLSNFQNKSCTYDLALLCQYAMNNQQFRQIVSCKIYETVINIESQQNCSLKQMDETNDHMDHEKIEKNNYEDESEQGVQLQQTMENIYQISQPQFNKNDPLSKVIRWQNTHQLLKQKPHLYTGIKTGVTSTAGPCLASCIQINGKRYILIVLNCKSMKYRFRDTQTLRKWLFNKEQIKYKDQTKVEEKNEINTNQLVELQDNK